ncbi:hypothetical protein HAX54_006162 [Datura stramonium]|uniref:DUF2921 domain-containing protein n=1 Tax=Datura stramonium TaxID=4076 RepID=A0ABS8WTT9_DATST|nr:hypothetical protein [Datura stramonium]
MPVQPMKSIAAVAVSEIPHLTVSQSPRWESAAGTPFLPRSHRPYVLLLPLYSPPCCPWRSAFSRTRLCYLLSNASFITKTLPLQRLATARCPVATGPGGLLDSIDLVESGASVAFLGLGKWFLVWFWELIVKRDFEPVPYWDAWGASVVCWDRRWLWRRGYELQRKNLLSCWFVLLSHSLKSMCRDELRLTEAFDIDVLVFKVPARSFAHQSKKSVSVSGLLQIGITLDGLFSSKPYERSPHFDIWPAESTDPWGWVKESGYTNQPPLMQDDRILLVLHYPRTNTLTNRAILGTMKSLNPKTSFKYFDEVHMSSWLELSKYEFGSEVCLKAWRQACPSRILECDEISVKDNVTSARVSSVFRVVSPLENQFTAAQRTGLNNMTLSAEGIWKSSSGQLCMVGCRGVVGAEESNCDSRICFLPLITGAEALFKMMGAEINETPSYDLDNSQWIRVIDYTVKVLVLVAFLITAKQPKGVEIPYQITDKEPS